MQYFNIWFVYTEQENLQQKGIQPPVRHYRSTMDNFNNNSMEWEASNNIPSQKIENMDATSAASSKLNTNGSQRSAKKRAQKKKSKSGNISPRIATCINCGHPYRVQPGAKRQKKKKGKCLVCLALKLSTITKPEGSQQNQPQRYESQNQVVEFARHNSIKMAARKFGMSCCNVKRMMKRAKFAAAKNAKKNYSSMVDSLASFSL